MAIYWQIRNQPGYTAHYNGAWSSFMNDYNAHPFDASATDPNVVDNLASAGSTTITAPYSGTYELRGAADNKGAIDLGGNNRTINGFSHAGKSVYTFFSGGSTIPIAWNFSNNPNGGTFSSNPCSVAIVLYGPDAPPPPTVSLVASPSSVIRGGAVTLTWSASGSTLSSASLTNYSNPGFSGSTTVYPQNTTTYTYTVCNEGGCTSTSKQVTVYIPPTITVEASTTFLILGQSANISWSTQGDADTIYWTSGGISNGNLNSNSNVTPSATTTYCAYVTGLGGTSPTSCVTVYVYQVPTIEQFDVPTTLDWEQQSTINVESLFANTSVTLEVFYDYGQGQSLYETRSLNTANSALADASEADKKVNQTIDTNIVYNETTAPFGPRTISWKLTVTGSGGTATQTKTTTINVDETPDNLVLAETEEKFKDQEPVFTPDIAPEQVVTSDLYLVEGIDVPVEIKSNYPIKIDVNNNDNWQDVRQR